MTAGRSTRAVAALRLRFDRVREFKKSEKCAIECGALPGRTKRISAGLSSESLSRRRAARTAIVHDPVANASHLSVVNGILIVMARRVTPAQFKAALQKAQRDQKRSIDAYNREARRFNAGVKKAVNDYNRDVRNYNTKARAHNREVENQRRRLRQEVARLNARPAGTTFVNYRQSTSVFVDAYDRADQSLASGYASAADQHFLDLVSDEAANSVYLANALDGDGEVAEAFTEDELRAPSMANELRYFGEDLVSRWTGALFALSPQNPDAARHFCTSAREVVTTMLDTSAPDAEVKDKDPGCELTESGAVTRRSKVTYLLRLHGVTVDQVAAAVSEDVDNLLSLFRTFNDGTHGHAGRFDMTELSAIRNRVEGAIRFVHTVVSVPA